MLICLELIIISFINGFWVLDSLMRRESSKPDFLMKN